MSLKIVVADLLRKLPDSPGVYQFFDATGALVYVGKAKVLKNRVKSYFQQGDKSPKTERLVAEIADLKWIETTSEVEALALEANLVREHQPKYNVLLRDDKNFLYFKVTTHETYPQVLAVRRVEKDGARYFGPKVDAGAVRETLRSLEKLFHARVCGVRSESDHARTALRRVAIKLPCPYFGVGMCPGPALDDPEVVSAYATYVRQVLSFLAGNTREVVAELKAAMLAAATQKNFEYAAKLRDELKAIEQTAERHVVSDPDLVSRDIVALVPDNTRAYVALLEVREGRLIDQKNFILKIGEEPLGEVIEGFLTQYYQLAPTLPSEVVLGSELPNAEIIEEWLSGVASRRVTLVTPLRGKKSSLLRLAEKNAEAYRVQNKARFENASERTVGAAKELAAALGIEKVLKRIECYDISHLGGEATTASMVVALDGEPRPAEYRQFKIRSLAKGAIDDYASLAEVLRRRMNYLVPQVPQGIKIRRATKKDLKLLQEQLSTHQQATFTLEELAGSPAFVALDESGVLVGYVRECTFGERQIHVVKDLWVDSAWQGHHLGLALVRKLIDMSDEKRFYLDCAATLADYYAELGFQVTQQPIPELTVLSGGLKAETVHMLYVKTKAKLDESFGATPDLIILDGGKGQLSAVLGGVQFPKKTTVVALAKQYEELWRKKDEGRGTKDKGVAKKNQSQDPGLSRQVGTPGVEREGQQNIDCDQSKNSKMHFEPIRLPPNSNALHLVTRVRDEAHRFANELRKKVLGNTEISTALDAIPGVGEGARTKLLQRFGSADGVRHAAHAELLDCVGEELTRNIEQWRGDIG